MLSAILAAGIAIRLPLAVQLGFPPDMTLFGHWASLTNEGGLASAYLDGANYPPLYLYVLGLLARLGGMLGLGGTFYTGDVPAFLLKAPGIVGDLLLGLSVYFAALQWMSPRRALFSVAAIVLNPALIYATTFWGQVDCLHTLLMVLAVGLTLRAHFTLGGAASALALATKVQSLVILPVLLVLVLKRGAGATAAALLGGVGAFGLALVPVALESVFGPVLRAYEGVASQFPSLTLNAFNLWYLFVRGSAAQGGTVSMSTDDTGDFVGPLSYRAAGLVLLAGWTALNGVILARGDLPWRAWVSAAAVTTGFFYLPTQMHERYLYPAVVFLGLVSPLSIGLAALWVAASVTFLLNLALVFRPPAAVNFLLQALGDGTPIAVALANGVLLVATLAWMVTADRASAPPEDDPVQPRLGRPAAFALFTVAIFGAAALAGTVMPREPAPFVHAGLDSYARPTDLTPMTGFRVVGFRVAPECPRPGNVVHLSIYWQADHEDLPRADTVVRLVGSRWPTTVLSRRDPGAGVYPTTSWRLNQVVRDDHVFWLAEDLPPGTYELEAGIALSGESQGASATLDRASSRFLSLQWGSETNLCQAEV